MRLLKRAWLAGLLLAACPAFVRGQTIDDGVMMPHRALCTGFLYTHDRWDQYWEGTLKRSNGNIGTLTTQSVTWVGVYGVNDRLNVIALLPYVWTQASQGVLHGMHGLQDVTLAAKYELLNSDLAEHGFLRGFVVASGSAPASRYSPDFLPMSIGSASKRAAGRATLHYQTKRGWFAAGSAAYTWRANVTLDRPAYFTEDQLFLSDQVAMPNVFDYRLSVGYIGGSLQVPISFTGQSTRGGGDIRRQDMPFVSNKMDYSKIEAMVMYYLPHAKNLSLQVAGAYTLSGRNVGQSTTLTGGLLYTLHF